MNQTKTWVIALCAVLLGQFASAQKGTEDQLAKEADAYFEQGAYLKAFPLYSQLVSLYPNHAEYTFKFGACAIYGDPDKTKAVRYLNAAINKSVNNPDVYFFLGKAYHLNYQFKDAITAYENYVRYAGDKALRRDQALRQIETCIYGANLLANIQDITVISKTETDKANFFRYFNLEAIGGKILTVPDALKSKEDLKSPNPGVIHYPGNGTTIYFSSYGKGTATGKDIYKAQVLADGTFSIPEKLKGGVNTKYDEDYCFMHSDGKTLYFASKGHNSMGGYDIFKSVYDPTTGEFGPAVNLDFAINTPDDDIFYIADSLNQRAYFASARSSDQDHLNVYNVLVESTPLQIVYIKGMFVSEIDPEQHKVGVKIIESNAQRSVCEGASNNVGEYLVYVPKSGQYKFKVVTENSPTIHEVSVDIPSFDKPVALRQEMRLINEGGRERIIVNNYFESPLQEDLSVLAADMLRKKSALDVNAGDNATVSLTKTDVKKEDELRTFDQNLNNATIAAGFEGGSVMDITSEMKTELSVIQRFVQQSDTKRNNSLAFARKKEQEAEALLAQAEAIRSSLPADISSEADIANVRKLVELTDQASNVRLEAQAALNTARAISSFKESETRRAESLQASINAIEQANEARNYDGVVAALTKEKDRRTAIRNGVEGAPYDQMMAKTKSLENNRARMESALTELRESEKSLERQANKLKEALNDTGIKKSEREAMQNEIAAIESELAGVRGDLSKKQASFNQSEEGIRQSYADASFFKKVNDDSSSGLSASEQVTLTSTERDVLENSIASIETRVSQLEINDPKILAMLGKQASTDGNTPAVSTASAPAGSAKSDTENTAVSGEKAWTGEAAEIRSTLEGRLAIIESRPELAPARTMLLRSTLTETRERIAGLEARLLDGTISSGERATLQNLKTYEPILSQDFASAEAANPEVSSEDVREMCKIVDPEYTGTLTSIENEDITEIERAQKRMEYKDAVMTRLENRQLANARSLKSLNLDAANVESMKELERLTNEDVQLVAAIENLAAEANHVTALQAAFEIENKAIIESDEVFSKKLQDQLVVGEQYLSALNTFEAALRKDMNSAAPSERQAFEIELQAIAEQRQIVEAKQVAYRHDLELTASAADPSESETRADSATVETTDELDPLAVTTETVNTNTLRVNESEGATEETQTETTTAGTIEETETAAETEKAKATATAATAIAEKATTEAAQESSAEAVSSQVENQPEPVIETTTEVAVAATTNEVSTNSSLTVEASSQNTSSQEVSAANTSTNEDSATTSTVDAVPAETTSTEEKTVETEAQEIKEIFAPKQEVGSIFAYETAMFDQLVDKHPKISSRLNNREELQILNDEITILEGEMDVTRSESGRRKLDAKAEQLYLKRAMLEIENATVVGDMTRAEYNEELSKSNEAVALNQEQLNERVQVRDEVAKLRKEAELNMQSAEKLREQARPLFDDIERADYYRQAYALEAKAIDQQRQIQDICANLPMLNQYSESQLAMLKSGTVPADLREENASSTEQVNLVSETTNSPSVSTATTTAASETTTETSVSTTAATSATTNSTPSEVSVVVTEPVAVSTQEVESTTNIDSTSNTESTINAESIADFGQNSIANTTEVSNEAVVTETIEPATNASTPEVTSTESATEKSTVAVVSVSEAVTTASESAPAMAEGTSKSSAAASANAADYYYSMPAEVVATLFAKTARGVYSDARPIPIDAEMPKGVYYKVQIGAFRNDIPQNLYDQFAPISGERLNTGITRYTAGFFAQFENARQAKQEIRSMGYGDAFIVAYRDGKRIPLYEAAAITDTPEVASAIKAAFEKAASAPSVASTASTVAAAATSSTQPPVVTTPSSGSTITTNAASNNAISNVAGNDNSAVTAINVDAEVAAELSRKPLTRTVEEIEQASSKPKNTQYYPAKDKTAAPADQVEAIEGLFYTVQVGVYSKPVAASLLKDINPLNSELTENNKIRYTTGQFRSMQDAVNRRDEIRKLGIEDAFVVAYYNGNRISLSEADLLLKEKGESILAK